MDKSSPMMEQYRKFKEQHPDKLLLFQVGDFYELFYDDAITAAKEMEIALTSRDAGSDNPIPLAGVPIHSAEGYLNKLLNKGYKVVICDQVEEAAQAKGLVRRDITRILTPGTITDPEMLEESRNNYLAVLVNNHNSYFGLAAVDVSTGDFKITEYNGDKAREIIAGELKRLQPAEIICGSAEVSKIFDQEFSLNHNCLIDILHNLPDFMQSKELITEQWGNDTWIDLGLDRFPQATIAAAAALIYLDKLQQLPSGYKHFHQLELYFNNRNMIIDSITSRNLELTSTIRDGSKTGSLLGLLDHCMTGMGRRFLRRTLEQPLLDRKMIEKRLDSVEELFKKPLQRRDLRKILDGVFDLERFCSRLTYQRVNARDLVALKKTLYELEKLKKSLNSFSSSMLSEINKNLPAFVNLSELINSALVNEPPLSVKDGGLFKEGFNEEVDRLKAISSDGKNLLLQFENDEKQRTGIKSLRVGYNRNFGYYMEVTKTNLDLVPPEYHRKQTLVNAERYTVEELNKLEEQIIGARDKLAALEYNLFEELRAAISNHTYDLLSAAYEVAKIDFFQGLAEAAELNKYSRPRFTDKNRFMIKEGRHPVVEQLGYERYVPNDYYLDKNNYILVITGPNMAGKSTYIRCAALISIMAQTGSFVPAEKAELPIIDRIFARIGASDDLSKGHSTFMVEMQETATILNEATNDSLVVLDEIGRGTSTYDGMSIARSVIEYISSKIKAKTLFSTHYHELTNLESEVKGIKNYTMAVKERGKEVIFLRQVVAGKADKSYGINVARLAGVPMAVLARAETILAELELAASNATEKQLSLLPMVSKNDQQYSPSLELIEEIKELDINHITPMDALQKFYLLQQKIFDIEKNMREEEQE